MWRPTLPRVGSDGAPRTPAFPTSGHSGRHTGAMGADPTVRPRAPQAHPPRPSKAIIGPRPLARSSEGSASARLEPRPCLSRPGPSPRSRDIHEGNLRRYLKPFFGDEDVAAIGPEQVGELRRHLLTPGATKRKERLGGKSVEDVLGTLRRILTHAEARGIVSTNAVAT